MLLSMTGFGEAHRQADGVGVSVELRTVNNRSFKLTVKCGEGYSALESEIENVVRSHVRRGTLQVALRVDRTKASDDFKLNVDVLASYRRQLDALSQQWHEPDPVSLEALLQLPGVVSEHVTTAEDAERDWPLIKQTLIAALENLAKMRTDEGRAMATDLKANCDLIAGELSHVEKRAPEVVAQYRARLTERIAKIMSEFQVTLNSTDLIREVSLFADRSDISEEIVRLRSHLRQFDQIVGLDESSGRKLEFLTQEMFREANTIGSKANDTTIVRHVIDIKAAIERIKEMIANVE